MNQEEFNQFYDLLRKYADRRASRLFYDVSLRQEAIDAAMDRVIDRLLKGEIEGNKIAYCKTVVRNSLYNSVSRRKIEPVNLSGTEYNVWGFRGRRSK